MLRRIDSSRKIFEVLFIKRSIFPLTIGGHVIDFCKKSLYDSRKGSILIGGYMTSKSSKKKH